MQLHDSSWKETLAKCVRWVLLGGIAAFVLLLVFGRRAERLWPAGIPPAQAYGVVAAPGYLSLPVDVGANSRFYLMDTPSQVVCVYQLTGDRIRLVAVREFSRDTDILDASMDVKTATGLRLPAFEGRGGITAKEAADFADAQKLTMEELEKKRKP